MVIHGLRHQDLQQGMALEPAMRALLEFIGPRELVGYHIAYDLRILNLACQRLWGLTLPQRGIEVSRLYHDHLYRRYPDAAIDLHLAAICRHLALPALPPPRRPERCRHRRPCLCTPASGRPAGLSQSLIVRK